MKPRADHPWYGSKNHVKKKHRKIADALLDREIERAAVVENFVSESDELEDVKLIFDKGVEHLDYGCVWRQPIRYDND